MPTWLWRFVALVAIGIALGLTAGDILNAGPGGDFGLSARADGPHEFVVTSVEPDSPAARAGLATGDRIVPAVDDIRSRFLLLYPGAPPNAPLTLLMHARGVDRRVSLQAAATAPPSWEAAIAAYSSVYAIQAIRIVFFLVAALIVVRRPDRAEARALATFLAAFAFGTISRWPWYPIPLAVVLAVLQPIVIAFAILQAIRFATLFPRPSTGGPRRTIARLNDAIIFAAPVIVGGLLALTWAGLVRGAFVTLIGALMNVFLAGSIVALGTAFALGSREAEPADRERVRWIAVSTGIGLGGLIVAAILQQLGVTEFVVEPFVLAILAIPLGTAYAILRHRLLDIGFVVNRALVFGIISALIVAAFSLLEFVLGKYVSSLGHVQSAVIGALVALGIGVSLGRIHMRVDSFVDNVFFRDRHRAEAALRRVAREAAYVDDPKILATRVITALERHAKAGGAALYLRDGNGSYVAQVATISPAPPVSRNDAAVVRMCASGEAVDLDEVAEEVERPAFCGKIAFPMIVRGELLGVLACGEKTNLEAYAPDERATLGGLAHATGIAFDTIATKALRDAVARVIAGDGDIEDLRRAQAPPFI
jgi:hypothetical protein